MFEELNPHPYLDLPGRTSYIPWRIPHPLTSPQCIASFWVSKPLKLHRCTSATCHWVPPPKRDMKCLEAWQRLSAEWIFHCSSHKFAERTVVHSGNGYQKTLITNNSPKNLASPHRILTYSLIPPVCSFIFQAPMLPNLREKLHPFRGRGGCPSLRCVRSSSTKVPIWHPEQRFLKVQKTVHRFGDPKDPCIFTYI